MNLLKKTLIFVVVAAGLSVVTWATRPSLQTVTPEDMVNKELFPDFKDPLAATSLEIVKYDSAQDPPVATFKVAQVNNRWSIPSHQGYPADAENQLADVAGALMHLKVLDLASSPSTNAAENVQAEHELFGVVDPGAKTVSAGAEGVGTRVTMRDKGDNVLLSLILGKQVPDRDGLYYVRRAGQDPVYVVKASTDKLSTKFEDWIEKDLLKLSSWDIKQVDIQDYSVDILAGEVNDKARMTLEYNDTGDPRWKLVRDERFDDNTGKWAAEKMGADEELNTTNLDALRTAIDDLKIVDVARKPKGLSANLRTEGELKLDPESQQSLQDRGFYLARRMDPSNPGQMAYELRSDQGEFHVLMKDGVKYILRFGQIAGSTQQDKPQGAKDEKDAASGEASGSESVNRYLFVMAEFDPSAIEKPVLEKLPDAKPADKDAAKPADKEAAKSDEAAKDEGGKDAAEKEDPAKTEADAKAERERIEKENKQKQDEYNDKLKQGQDKVKELNGRFADWYYVISEDIYKKIHLGRKEIVKPKEKTEEEKKAAEESKPEGSLGDFESLKSALPAASEPAAMAPPADEPPAEPAADDKAAQDDEASSADKSPAASEESASKKPAAKEPADKAPATKKAASKDAAKPADKPAAEAKPEAAEAKQTADAAAKEKAKKPAKKAADKP